MTVKFTAERMANMSRLFNNTTDREVFDLAARLYKEAEEAGVYEEASTVGLSMAQWEIVREPRKSLRELVLETD